MKSSGCPIERTGGERSIGAGRHFKLDVKNRFLMLLVYYYRLYITYTLAGFLFDLDQSNVCRDIRKIEPLVRKCVQFRKRGTAYQQGCAHQKRLKGTFRALFLSPIAQNSRYQGLKAGEEISVLFLERGKVIRKDTAHGQQLRHHYP